MSSIHHRICRQQRNQMLFVGLYILLCSGCAEVESFILQSFTRTSLEKKSITNLHDHRLRSTAFSHYATVQPQEGSSVRSSASSLLKLLHRYGFHSRVVSLSTKNTNVWCEIYVNGGTSMGRIDEFVWNSDGDENDRRFVEPKVRVTLLSNLQTDHHSDASSSQIIDFGQITTLWSSKESGLQQLQWNHIQQKSNTFPSTVMEKTFDRIHASIVRRGRKGGGAVLTKKKIASEVAQAHNHDNEGGKKEHTEQTLRKVQKVGSGFARLIDSSDILHELTKHGNKQRSVSSLQMLRAVAALLVTRDAKEGGRFKRWSSAFVEHDPATRTIKVLNGGWLVLDQSVRAVSEAQKFVARSTQLGPEGERVVQTASDARIKRRLECLAMGEDIFNSEEEELVLHVDVKQTLQAMGCPPTPVGARDALVRMGQWSGSTVQPWPEKVLEAATSYQELSQESLLQMDNGRRIDLTRFPCVCVDAQGTTFRDDAIGIRPRAGTGRPVDPDVSKWEILIHIVDVSDIYTPPEKAPAKVKRDLTVLKEAAESRGTSRYDLPFGPLHLMPPSVLKVLGFSKKKPIQKCVTLWAYIDERDGRVRDMGLERTITSKPVELTYHVASSIMDRAKASSNPEASKIRALLLVLDRHLSKWYKKRYETSIDFQKREARMSGRERESLEMTEYLSDSEMKDQFQRTRSHRLVDSALELYAWGARQLLKNAKSPIPLTPGAEDGRSATAPLRRYIDGMCQKQLLAVILGVGNPLSLEECRQAGRVANEARNTISKTTATKQRKQSQRPR